MIAQPLRAAAATLACDGLEHVGHLARIVAGTCHDLRAKQVRFALVLTAVFEEVRAKTELRTLRDHAASAAANNRSQYLPGDRAKLKFPPMSRLP